MDIIPELGSRIQPIAPDWYGSKIAELAMLRLDLIHPVVSGNKWFKLKYNLQQAKELGHSSVLTFGGAYSNHLIATATAAKTYGMKSVGIVRGIHAATALTPTLKKCREEGMDLHFVERKIYDAKNSPQFLKQLSDKFQYPFIIPEGGANEAGRRGAGDIALWIPDQFDHVCVSVGSGTTFAGLRNALSEQTQMLGFVPMKNGAYLKQDIAGYLHSQHESNWQLFDRWHFGGFGKHTNELIDFMNAFYSENKIPLDVVYTAKMMFGLRELIMADWFPPHARVLCIHTGGLQGNSSIAAKLHYL